MFQLALELANSFCLNGRHGTLAAVHLARDRPSFREDRLRLKLLSNHEDVELDFRSHILEILDVLNDAFLSDLVARLSPTDIIRAIGSVLANFRVIWTG